MSGPAVISTAATGVTDAAAILGVCRACFPRAARWRLPGARRWWARVLADASADCVVAREAARDVGAGGGPIVGFALLVHDEARFAVVARRPLRELLARIRGGRRSGHVIATPRDASDPRSWVELIAVDPAQGGRGIGGMLLRHCIGEAGRRGRDRIEGLVAEENLASRRLFEGGGFAVAATPPGARVYRTRATGRRAA